MVSSSRQRIVGYILVVLGAAWTCFNQMMLMMAPAAMASEAPYRHLQGKETFNRKDAFDFSFALAKDINERLPNVVLPLVPILAGVWLLSRSAPGSGTLRKTRDDTTPTI